MALYDNPTELWQVRANETGVDPTKGPNSVSGYDGYSLSGMQPQAPVAQSPLQQVAQQSQMSGVQTYNGAGLNGLTQGADGNWTNAAQTPMTMPSINEQLASGYTRPAGSITEGTVQNTGVTYGGDKYKVPGISDSGWESMDAAGRQNYISMLTPDAKRMWAADHPMTPEQTTAWIDQSYDSGVQRADVRDMLKSLNHGIDPGTALSKDYQHYLAQDGTPGSYGTVGNIYTPPPPPVQQPSAPTETDLYNYGRWANSNGASKAPSGEDFAMFQKLYPHDSQEIIKDLTPKGLAADAVRFKTSNDLGSVLSADQKRQSEATAALTKMAEQQGFGATPSDSHVAQTMGTDLYGAALDPLGRNTTSLNMRSALSSLNRNNATQTLAKAISEPQSFTSEQIGLALKGSGLIIPQSTYNGGSYDTSSAGANYQTISDAIGYDISGWVNKNPGVASSPELYNLIGQGIKDGTIRPKMGALGSISNQINSRNQQVVNQRNTWANQVRSIQ